MDSSYCRFCAQLKSGKSLLNFDDDDKKCCEIELKLSFLNAVYVNMSHRDNIPKTICFTCHESLNNAYEFLRKVREVQDILKVLFSEKQALKIEEDEPVVRLFYVENNETSTLKVENHPKDEEAYIQKKIKQEQEVPKDIFQDIRGPSERNLNIPENIEETTKKASNKNIKEETISTDDEAHEITSELDNSEAKEKSSWKQYTWICKYCNDNFPDLDALRTHSKTVHNRCAAFSCVDCNEYKKMKGKSFGRFLVHVKKHRPMLWNSCHYCDEGITKYTIRAHLQKHHRKPSRVCPGCGEIFRNKDLYSQHSEAYSHKKRTPLLPLPTTEDLTCGFCKKVSKNRITFQAHLKRHDGDRKRGYACDRCGKLYYKQSSLKLQSLETKHDKICPYSCKVCNLSFNLPYMLKKHVDVHTKEKPFSCGVCNKKFRLETHLANHKIVHTDSMPYSCQHCPKKFRFPSRLYEHRRQHTGEKPYSCVICDLTFSNWSNHNKHMRNSHDVETSKKKITKGIFPMNPETGQVNIKMVEFEE